MSFENRLINRIDQERRRERTELSPMMARAYEKANSEILANPDYAIQESDFISIYGPTAVAADIARVADLRHKFETNITQREKLAKKVADIFEAIVLMQSELSEWFGNARTLKTASYDDYTNKVDMIAEWFTPSDGSRLLALAVDVTFGTMSIEKKLAGIKAEIDNGKLKSIKYFKDERGDFIGTRNNVPRTVIGVSESVVEELAYLWIHKKNKDLSRHPIQHLFMNEIETQLTAMHDYAVKQKKSDAVLAYRQALGIVRPLHANKRAFESEELGRDRVAMEIARHTEEQFR